MFEKVFYNTLFMSIKMLKKNFLSFSTSIKSLCCIIYCQCMSLSLVINRVQTVWNPTPQGYMFFKIISANYWPFHLVLNMINHCGIIYTAASISLATYLCSKLNCAQNKSNVKLGAVSIRETVLPGMAIPMLKMRRPNGRLIFNMEIAIRR